MTGEISKTTGAPNGPRRSILLVDADVSVLALIKALLEGQGHRVLVADCAETAMRLVAQPRLRIDDLMTNVADPQAPDLAARVLDVRSETGMLFMSAVRDRTAVRFKMIDDGSDASYKGCAPDATAGNSYRKINGAEFDQNQSREPLTVRQVNCIVP